MMSRLLEPVAFSRGTFTRRNLPVQGRSVGRGVPALMSQPLGQPCPRRLPLT